MQGAWTGVFRDTGVRLCRILDMNFGESHIPRTSVNNPIFVTLLQKNHREFIGRCYTANPR